MKTFLKIHVFQLCNLNHIFSPTYLYIYEINYLREKSHWFQRSFWGFFGKIPYFRKCDILILFFNLFKKIFLAAQSQVSRLVRKACITWIVLLSFTETFLAIIFKQIILTNICKTQILFKCCNLIYLVNFVSIHLGRFYSRLEIRRGWKIRGWVIRQNVTAQKMKFSIKDFFSKCGQIRIFLRIWSHLQKKS